MLSEIVYIAGALIAGGAIGWLLAKQKTNQELSQAKSELSRAKALNEANESGDEKTRELLNEERKRVNELLESRFENIATEVNQRNTEAFLQLAEQKFNSDQKEAEKSLDARKMEVENLIKPLREEMTKLSNANSEMEKERVGAYEAIKRQLKELGQKADSLGDRTTALSTALTTSGQARGNWGEVKLRRLFEMAGMSEQVDFFEQETVEGGGRPDYIVRLPQEGVIPIDSKATGSHFLKAVELDSGPEQDAHLKEHAKAMKSRIKDLGAKAYQESIEGDFDHVVMFIPSEAMAAAAFTTDPELLDYAMTKSVLIATPVTMLGLLRTVALYWQQHALAEGAREIYDVSREMYKRTTTLMGYMMDVGAHLDKAGKSYNQVMRSYESRILPQGRRLDELKVSETLQEGLPEATEVETMPDRIEEEK